MITPNTKGFSQRSTTATVCEMLATRKRDAWHDTGHWSYAAREARTLARQAKREARARVLAEL